MGEGSLCGEGSLERGGKLSGRGEVSGGRSLHGEGSRSGWEVSLGRGLRAGGGGLQGEGSPMKAAGRGRARRRSAGVCPRGPQERRLALRRVPARGRRSFPGGTRTAETRCVAAARGWRSWPRCSGSPCRASREVSPGRVPVPWRAGGYGTKPHAWPRLRSVRASAFTPERGPDTWVSRAAPGKVARPGWGEGWGSTPDGRSHLIRASGFPSSGSGYPGLAWRPGSPYGEPRWPGSRSGLRRVGGE